MRIEYCFDFSCPYAYLGSTQIEAVARRAGAELVWSPMLLGGVFRAVDTPQNMSAGMPPAKARHNALDMHRWADLWSVPLRVPTTHPRRTVRALRAVLAAPEDRWPALIHELYAAYWVRDEDVAEPEVVARALEAAGVRGADAERALAGNDDPAVKDELRRRTDAAIARGVFGAPATFVDDETGAQPLLFWGQDRLHMVEAAATGWRPEDGPPARRETAPAPRSGGARLCFYYDFSSPFSYLASTQIEALAARCGAELSWRPMLLGAVFRDLGTANVPLLAMSEAKRRYLGGELARWASYWDVPFRFSSHFPIRTVTALRLALLAGDRTAELTGALYRAAWVEDRDLAAEDVLGGVLRELGFDAPAMLEATRDPATKQRLVQSTAEATARGVFGAPTCVVERGGTEQLFWGQDRLDLVERACGGWEPDLSDAGVA